MAIIQTVNSYQQFRDEFVTFDRHTQFTYDGLEMLYDYLNELSESTGENIELDVVSICCDYSESIIDDIIQDYNINWKEHAEHVGYDVESDDKGEMKFNAALDYLEKNTVVVGENEQDNTIVYANF